MIFHPLVKFWRIFAKFSFLGWFSGISVFGSPQFYIWIGPLILSWWRSLSNRNQSIDLQSKSMNWALNNKDHRHARFKVELVTQNGHINIWNHIKRAHIRVGFFLLLFFLTRKCQMFLPAGKVVVTSEIFNVRGLVWPLSNI